MGSYRYLEHTADIGVMAEGGTQAEAFEAAAAGLENLFTDTSKVRPDVRREIDLSCADREGLLVDFLNELIYFFDAEMLVFSKIEISEIDATHLKAKAYGEVIDPARHEVGTGVKATTYHGLEVAEDGFGWRIRVIFDI